MFENALQAELLHDVSKESDLKKSSGSWALFLSEITLHPNAGSFINQFIGRAEHVHYVSLCWDLSGASPTIYPHLNFKNNKLPIELRAAETHQFKGEGLNLFPDKKVVDSLNMALFIFKNKKTDQSIDAIFDTLERLVNNSQLRQELSKITFDQSEPDVSKIKALAELLYLDIEEVLSNKKLKHLGSIQHRFEVDDEWDFFGEKVLEKGLVRATLTKKRF